MSLILVVEPDSRHAAQLATMARNHLHAELVMAESGDRAVAALADRVPDIVLTAPLLPRRDEAVLAEYLRALGTAGAHVQTLTIPILSAPGSSQRVTKGRFRRSSEPAVPEGCDPALFAEQVGQYLRRARQVRTDGVVVQQPEHRHESLPEPATPKTLPPVAVAKPVVNEVISDQPVDDIDLTGFLAESPEPPAPVQTVPPEPTVEPQWDPPPQPVSATPIYTPPPRVLAPEPPVNVKEQERVSSTPVYMPPPRSVLGLEPPMRRPAPEPVEAAVEEPVEEPYVPPAPVSATPIYTPPPRVLEPEPPMAAEEPEPVSATPIYTPPPRVPAPEPPKVQAPEPVASRPIHTPPPPRVRAPEPPRHHSFTREEPTRRTEPIRREETNWRDKIAPDEPLRRSHFFPDVPPEKPKVLEPELVIPQPDPPAPRSRPAKRRAPVSQESHLYRDQEPAASNLPAVISPEARRQQQEPQPTNLPQVITVPGAGPNGQSVSVAVAVSVQVVTTTSHTPPSTPKPANGAKPIQDEWGFFDPDQCGFRALLARLDAIATSEEPES